jgi:hypothetical protein
MSMVDKDLSEPYSVFTYRYFLHNWPQVLSVNSSEGRRSLSFVTLLESG